MECMELYVSLSTTRDTLHIPVCGSVQLNPEEKLLRTLLRTDCDGVRKSMLQDRLQLPNHDIFLVSSATDRIPDVVKSVMIQEERRAI